MKKRPGPTRADDPSTLRPGYLATLAGVLVLVLGIFAWYESGESRRIMLDTLREGSTSWLRPLPGPGRTPCEPIAKFRSWWPSACAITPG